MKSKLMLRYHQKNQKSLPAKKQVSLAVPFYIIVDTKDSLSNSIAFCFCNSTVRGGETGELESSCYAKVSGGSANKPNS